MVLATAVFFGAATPAAPASTILSTKSIAPPAGARNICARYAWACATRALETRKLSDAQIIELSAKVNRRINREVREISDQRQYRRREHWSLPTTRGGDCEDFALLKKRELIRLGVDPSRLLMATALTPRREAHAVLIVRTGGGDLVLDNRTSRIKPWHKSGYAFLRMQDPAAPERWRMILAGGLFGFPQGVPDT